MNLLTSKSSDRVLSFYLPLTSAAAAQPRLAWHHAPDYVRHRVGSDVVAEFEVMFVHGRPQGVTWQVGGQYRVDEGGNVYQPLPHYVVQRLAFLLLAFEGFFWYLKKYGIVKKIEKFKISSKFKKKSKIFN